MKYIKSFVTLATLLMSVSTFAGAKCKSAIERKVKNNLVQFTYCADTTDRSTCHTMGQNKWYSIKDLESQRRYEIAKTIGNAGATLFIGGWAAASALTVPFSGGQTLILAVPLATLTTIYGVKTARRYQDINSLSAQLEGKNIKLDISCEEFGEMAMDFEDILNRIC
jgi:hypothetical protein